MKQVILFGVCLGLSIIPSTAHALSITSLAQIDAYWCEDICGGVFAQGFYGTMCLPTEEEGPEPCGRAY